MKEGRKPEYPKKTTQQWASENATYEGPKIHDKTNTPTRTLPLVVN